MTRAHANTQVGWTLRHGDALAVLMELEERSMDAIVTDPPYGIGLLGEPWDTRSSVGPLTEPEAFERFTERWASQCLRVLKPGGFLVAFGAPRTAHRLASGIEDAGFELRDTIVWLYGSGVPKAKLVAGRSPVLKPAHEPIILARKPLQGTLAGNQAAWGTGSLGIDAARIGAVARGRWPCNIISSHEDTCNRRACSQGCAVASLDRSRPATAPSRFFYCAKPSRREREAGCEHLPARRASIFHGSGTTPRSNTHPTVKPITLMRWLIRLSCPPGGVVLDPFAGSGSTGIAALLESRRFVGVEQDAEYTRLARARLRHTWRSEGVSCADRILARSRERPPRP